MVLNNQKRQSGSFGANMQRSEQIIASDLLPYDISPTSMQDHNFMEGKTILSLSEVTLIINKRYDINLESPVNKDIKDKHLLLKEEVLMSKTVDAADYCIRFGTQRTEEECARVRRVLAKLPLTPFEVVTLANLIPEDYQEAMAYVPSLKHNTTSLDVQRAMVALKENSGSDSSDDV